MKPRNTALWDRVASIDVVHGYDVSTTVLPSTGAVMGLQHRGRVRAAGGLLSIAGVTGIQTTAREYAYLGRTTSVLVRFTPQGASCLGVPASELAGRNLAIDDLCAPAQAREICERFFEAASDAARVAAGFMLPAMTQSDVDGFLARLPPAMGESLWAGLYP